MVMRLTTETRSPPNWEAMLPQKSSAATTASLPLANVVDDELALHADSDRMSTETAPPRRRPRRRDMRRT